MKRHLLSTLPLVCALLLAFSFQVNATGIAPDTYFLDTPLPIAAFYVGQYTNGSYFAINGTNWDNFMVGTDIVDVIETILNASTGDPSNTQLYNKSTSIIIKTLWGDMEGKSLTIPSGRFHIYSDTMAGFYQTSGSQDSFIDFNVTSGLYLTLENLWFGRKWDVSGAGHGIFYNGTNSRIKELNLYNVVLYGHAATIAGTKRFSIAARQDAQPTLGSCGIHMFNFSGGMRSQSEWNRVQISGFDYGIKAHMEHTIIDNVFMSAINTASFWLSPDTLEAGASISNVHLLYVGGYGFVFTEIYGEVGGGGSCTYDDSWHIKDIWQESIASVGNGWNQYNACIVMGHQAVVTVENWILDSQIDFSSVKFASDVWTEGLNTTNNHPYYQNYALIVDDTTTFKPYTYEWGKHNATSYDVDDEGWIHENRWLFNISSGTSLDAGDNAMAFKHNLLRTNMNDGNNSNAAVFLTAMSYPDANITFIWCIDTQTTVGFNQTVTLHIYCDQAITLSEDFLIWAEIRMGYDA